MFKNRGMQLLKVIFICFLFFISCKENKKHISNTIKLNNEKLQATKLRSTQNIDSIYVEKDTIVIVRNNQTKKYRNLAIDAMTLTSLIEVISKNEFDVNYFYTASTMKTDVKVKFILDEQNEVKIKNIYLLYHDYENKFGCVVLINKIVDTEINVDEIQNFYSNIDYELNPLDCSKSIKFYFKNKTESINNCNDKILMPIFSYQFSNFIGDYVYNDTLGDFNLEKVIDLKYNIPNINITNIQLLNNRAYYLEQSGAYDEAISLLETIIEKFPNRTVAYINLGDAYWGLDSFNKAKGAYQMYVKRMQVNDKENKIPKRVFERLK